MRVFRFGTECVLPATRDRVFDFFSNAQNLEQLTPPWLRFEIVSKGPIAMAPGTLIDYRIYWRRIPMRWRTEIEVWEPPHRFVDRQIRGPYRLWRHEHVFADHADGTSVIDRVEYAPFGGALVQRFFVARDIDRIFAYRQAALGRMFAASDPQ